MGTCVCVCVCVRVFVHLFNLHRPCLTMRLNACVCECNHSKAGNGRVRGGEVIGNTDRDNAGGDKRGEEKGEECKLVLLPSPLGLV
jgi:hypothetical protein